MMFAEKALMIDPPSGWRYGFPRPVPEDFFSEGFNFVDWLIECGYPAADVPLAINYSRYWEVKND